MRSIRPEIVDECFREPLDGKFGRTVGRVRHARSQRSPEAIYAARVDDAGFAGVYEQWQEGSRAKINPAPADVEGPIPLGAAIGEQAAAAPDAGIIEEQVHFVRLEMLGDLVFEAQYLL